MPLAVDWWKPVRAVACCFKSICNCCFNRRDKTLEGNNVNILCSMCGQFEEIDWRTHKNSATHRYNFYRYEYRTQRTKLCWDRGNIYIRLSVTMLDIPQSYNKRYGIFGIRIPPNRFNAIGRRVRINTGVTNRRFHNVNVLITLLEKNNEDFKLEETVFLVPAGGRRHVPFIFERQMPTPGRYEMPFVITIQPVKRPQDCFNIYKKIVVEIISVPTTNI